MMQFVSGIGPVRSPRALPARQTLMEGLESRTYMHDVAPGVVYPIGTLVPWLTEPITPVSPPVSPPPSPPSPPPPPGTIVGAVTGLTLINATSDADIGAFQNGATLDVSTGATFSVRADVGGGTVESVQFLLDGAVIRTESTAPFSVAGDSADDYDAWSVAAGGHTLTVIPFSGANGTGGVGSPVTISFTVTGQPPSPPPPSSGFTQVNWATKAAAPQGKAEALSATWNGRLYVFGGFSGPLGPVTSSHYYDMAANSWHSVQKLPQPITHAGVAEDANSVYFVGGYVGKGDGTGYAQTFGSTKVWRYDFASNTYTAIRDLPRALAGGGAALVGRQLHYFGGYELNRTDSTVHLVLDLHNTAAGWQSAAAMTNSRNHQGVAVIGGKIYAIAGQTGTDAGLVTKNNVQVYDPATNAWTMRATMPASVSHMHSATFVMGGRIIVLGGETAHNSPTRGAYAYDPAADKWVTLTLLPAARFSGVASTFNGKIYFTTGGGNTTTWEGTPG